MDTLIWLVILAGLALPIVAIIALVIAIGARDRVRLIETRLAGIEAALAAGAVASRGTGRGSAERPTAPPEPIPQTVAEPIAPPEPAPVEPAPVAAYGLRNEEYLRLKILTCMLPAL